MAGLYFRVCAFVQIILACNAATNCTFRYANTFGTNMVLQKAPFQPSIWGFGPAGKTVNVRLVKPDGTNEQTSGTVGSDCMWQVFLKPEKASFNKYSIHTFLTNAPNNVLSITNVLFGDVYICSGQSNMMFTVSGAFNATAEIADAINYPHIRLFDADLVSSKTPLDELKAIRLPWSVASPKTVNGTVKKHWDIPDEYDVEGNNWQYFSAVCWFYAKYLFDELQYPLGMISTNWGGTPIRAWSPPNVNSMCKEPKHSELWNAMIVPFLKTTIYGALWYQGEADSSYQFADLYSCTFPKMIESWRLQWNAKSGTSNKFPFGFVQLSTWSDSNQKDCNDNYNCTLTAVVRWGQTGNHGFVPNVDMENTFMAVSVDLGDPKSPFGDIHPRYKQQVTHRLVAAGLRTAYGKNDVYAMGPVAANSSARSKSEVAVQFFNVNGPLTMTNNAGFEVKIGNHWESVKLKAVTADLALIDISNNRAESVTEIRYLWKRAPCFPTKGPYNCAVYCDDYPAGPFILRVL